MVMPIINISVGSTIDKVSRTVDNNCTDDIFETLSRIVSRWYDQFYVVCPIGDMGRKCHMCGEKVPWVSKMGWNCFKMGWM